MKHYRNASYFSEVTTQKHSQKNKNRHPLSLKHDTGCDAPYTKSSLRLAQIHQGEDPLCVEKDTGCDTRYTKQDLRLAQVDQKQGDHKPWESQDGSSKNTEGRICTRLVRQLGCGSSHYCELSISHCSVIIFFYCVFFPDPSLRTPPSPSENLTR